MIKNEWYFTICHWSFFNVLLFYTKMLLSGLIVSGLIVFMCVLTIWTGLKFNVSLWNIKTKLISFSIFTENAGLHCRNHKVNDFSMNKETNEHIRKNYNFG